MSVKYVPVVFFLFTSSVLPQSSADDPQQTIPLNVPAGVPLRLYLTKRIPKKLGAPVEAKLLEPVYAFDRQVIPAGADVLGRVTRLEPVPKFQRAQALLGGDLTPLHRAKVEFTFLRFPDRHEIALHTQESAGLNSIFSSNLPKRKNPKPPKPQQQSTGVLGTGKQTVKDQINGQINARLGVARSIPDLVRGPDKMERLSDYLMAKLPYHPQYVRKGTRFDAELKEPLSFGSATVTRSSMLILGSQPNADAVVHARLLTALDSATSTQGGPVEAVLSEPLFSPDHKLLLPEGTRLSGAVAVAKGARLFHRSGQLRFNFQSVELPAEAAQLNFSEPINTPEPAVEYQKVLKFRSQAILKNAEGDNAPIKVDSEGSVKATESKTGFIQTAVALLIARSAADNDAGRNHVARANGPNTNVSGRTLGGGLGLGLLGSLLAQTSRNVGAALGYYGLGWSVYSTVVARGAEVQFNRNAIVDIGFNPRAASSASK